MAESLLFELFYRGSLKLEPRHKAFLAHQGSLQGQPVHKALSKPAWSALNTHLQSPVQ